MKMRIAFLTILCLALAAVPALAQYYDNGPINGTNDAWTISSGYVVSDTFFTYSSNPRVAGFQLGVWEFPGDTLSAVQWSITSTQNARTVYGSGTASGKSLTDQFISTNQFGYNIDKIRVTGLDVPFNSNTPTWLNLQNASVASGDDPVYWDENSGVGCGSPGCPSKALQSGVGTISSEAFSVDICSGCTCGLNPAEGCSLQSGGTPEPSSFLLFGSGILGLVGLLRGKLNL